MCVIQRMLYEYMNKCTLKFDITASPFHLIKFFKNPVYREIQYIENEDYDNPFQTSAPLYQDFTYDHVYQRSSLSV